MANDVTDAMVEAAAKSLCEYHCVAISGPCIEERKCSGWQVWTAPAKEALHDALAARPLPEGVETTAEEREAYARAAETELVWPEAGFVGRLLRDFDRLSAEIASLKARLAEAEAEKGDITHLLAEAVDDGVHLRAVIREAKTDKAKAVKAEREVCADLIESFTLGWPFTRADVAAAIRARGGDNG